MHILLMGQHYWPEDISGAVLATQFAESLIARGHQVTFVTAFPSYPKGIVFDGYQGKLFSREIHNEVEVLRVWSHTAPKEAIKRRFVNYATISISLFFAGMFAKRPDIIMSYSPPMPLGVFVAILRRLKRVPWVLRVEDLFPEYAIKAGVIRNPTVIRALEWFERFQYRNATRVSVISEGFRQKLRERGVPDDKIVVTPVWADPGEVKPVSRDTAFRRENGWQDKFIILYSGNLGLTCALEDALETARLLKPHMDIQFVIVGEGMKKNELMTLAEQKNLPNLVFWPYQPRERFPELLATADATLVTLNEESHSTSLPGKTFNYLACGRPILTMAPLHSELCQIISNANAGVCVPPAKPDELAEAILALKADPAEREKKGRNGRQLLETKFSREYAVNMYESLFKRLAQTN